MSDRIHDLKRCIAEKYGYVVRHIAAHEVEQPLEDGVRFAGLVDEFETTEGSQWSGCFAWLATSKDLQISEDCPHQCFAVPKFAVITDAVAAVRWVYGIPLDR
jgi:hypothetical protein